MRRCVLVLAMCGACGGGSDHEVPEGNARVGGDVVSTVDGHPIHLDSVTSLARSADLAPAEALERRQSEELLALEAWRRGYGDRAEPQLRERQRLVQALLDRVAAEVPLDSIGDDEIREHFARRRAELAAPERRAIRHIVVQVDREADEQRWSEAERFALRLRGEWVTDASAFDRYREVEELESYSLQVEASALIGRGTLESVLEEAVFRVPEPGILPDAYRSSGGWHAIEVTTIERSEPPELAEVIDQMRDEIADERRRQRLFELVERAEEHSAVEIDEVVAARALSLELQ